MVKIICLQKPWGYRGFPWLIFGYFATTVEPETLQTQSIALETNKGDDVIQM